MVRENNQMTLPSRQRIEIRAVAARPRARNLLVTEARHGIESTPRVGKVL